MLRGLGMTEAQGERDRSREVAEREGLRSYRNRRREKRVVGKMGGGGRTLLSGSGLCLPG